MSNGNQQLEWKNARDLTAEIDRATDAELETGAAHRADTEPEVDRLGRRVIVGRETIVATNEVGPKTGEMKTEMGAEMAELVRDEEQLVDAEKFVGEESRLQSKERMADDIEDARNEAGEGLGFENRIVAKNQEAVAKAIAPEIEKIVGQKSFRPRDLERVYRQGVNTTLGVFGRRIGDRN